MPHNTLSSKNKDAKLLEIQVRRKSYALALSGYTNL